MTRNMVHRDQVHGDVEFDPMAVALLDTPALQRLGRVYQLGYAHLVYRGGNHTRLSHVMGTAHAADLIVWHLRENYQTAESSVLPHVMSPDQFLPKSSEEPLDVRWDILRHLTRWAGLLHDVGHVPLGHTLEDEFEGIFPKHDDFRSPRIPYLWWESHGEPSKIRATLERTSLWPTSFSGLKPSDVSRAVMLIALYKEKRRTAEEAKGESFLAALNKASAQLKSEEQTSAIQYQAEFVDYLRTALDDLNGTLFFPYMVDIVGNTICADYLDYARRDPANVGLDVLRDNRVLRRFFIAPDPGSTNGAAPRMALALVDRHGKPRLDTCTGVVELVRQRYRFAEIIYYHKTKVSASAMFAKALQLLGKDKLRETPLTPRPLIAPSALAKRVVASTERAAVVRQLREELQSGSLLDVEMGDEALHLFVKEAAWKALTDEDNPSSERLAKLFWVIELISSIQERRLYKVAATIDAKQFAQLSPGVTEGRQADQRIFDEIRALREDPALRERIETAMTDAGEWEEGLPVLLYVPPRKVQAKGIETFALAVDGVTTLSEHPAVRKKVDELSADYRALWKMIVLVHPDLREDEVALSRAVDAMCLQLWAGVDLRANQHVIRDLCWFNYVTPEQRNVATNFKESYKSLSGGDPPGKEQYCYINEARSTLDGVDVSETAAVIALLRGAGCEPLVAIQEGNVDVKAVASWFRSNPRASKGAIRDMWADVEKGLLALQQSSRGRRGRRARIGLSHDEMKQRALEAEAAGDSELALEILGTIVSEADEALSITARIHRLTILMSRLDVVLRRGEFDQADDLLIRMEPDVAEFEGELASPSLFRELPVSVDEIVSKYRFRKRFALQRLTLRPANYDGLSALPVSQQSEFFQRVNAEDDSRSELAARVRVDGICERLIEEWQQETD